MDFNRREFIFGGASLFAFPMMGFGKQISEHTYELNDLIEFSKTCNIINLKDGVVNFNPRPYQIEYFKNILESNTLVCRKCRQCGATTMNLIYAHWMAERHPEKKVVLVFNRMSTVNEAKNKFDAMFYDNPRMWHQNTPSVEFMTYDSFISSCNEIYIQNKDCLKYPLYTNAYLNSNTILVFDEYAFHDFICVNLGDVKSIWISTPNIPNDMMWGNGNSSKTITRMKITGEQVFPQYRLEEFRQCLGDERFNQEIQV